MTESESIHLLDKINEHSGFHTGIFFTYGADLAFFEEVVLHRLWQNGCRNNLVFIDAISKTITDKPKQDKDCYYVRAPNALVELSLTITKFLKHDFNYLIFDSLTNLLIYQKKAPIAKFASSLVNKIKASKTKAILLALDVSEHEQFIQEVSIFVDEIVRI